MDFLGIGPLELAFIILIALIVLGPNDMVKAGKTIGRFLRGVVTSDSWRTIQHASKEMRDLPNRLIREAGLEDIQKDLPEAKGIRRELGLDDLNNEMQKAQDDLADWTTPPMNEAPQQDIQAEKTPGDKSLDAETPPEKQVQSKIDTSDIGSIGQPGDDKEADNTDPRT
jgi:Sec-independent protein translocase protein TatA